MDWVKHAVWWQAYSLGFYGTPIRDSEPTPAPRLHRLVGQLDYAIELRTSGLLLGPVFASQTHGYDVADQLRTNPRLGDGKDFNALVVACSQRGLRFLLDEVFSHANAQHPDMIRTLDEGPGGSATGLFDIDRNAPGGPAPRVFEGYASLVRLNHASEWAAQYVTAVIGYWLARGVDGQRFGATYSVDTGFWVHMIPAVWDRHPNAWLFGETIHGNHSRLTTSSSFDATTRYELWEAIRSNTKDRSSFELNWTLNRHNDFLTHFTPNVFIGNHDMIRIASVIGSGGAIMASVTLLTLGGIPSIYCGDERGFTGIKKERTGGDGTIQPAFPNTPSGLVDWGQNVHRTYQDLIGLRHRNPWLIIAVMAPLHLENTRYVYRAAARDGSNHPDAMIDIAGVPSLVIKNASGHVPWG